MYDGLIGELKGYLDAADYERQLRQVTCDELQGRDIKPTFFASPRRSRRG
jgi:hypothetical protein